MPKIPRFLGENRITGEAPAAEMEPSRAREPGKALQEVGESFTQIGQEFKKLRDFQESTEALAKSNQELNEIYLESQEEKDVYAEEKYWQKMMETRQRAVPRITDPETRLKFQGQFDLDAQRVFFNIRQDFRKRQIDKSHASLIDAIDTSSKQYIEAQPQIKVALKKQMFGLIDQGAKLGTIRFDRAEEWKNELESSLIEDQIANDISQKPSSTLQKLQSGDYEREIGRKIDPSEKLKFLRTAGAFVSRANTARKNELERMWDENESKLYTKFTTEGVTLLEINEAETLGQAGLQGGISKGFAESMRRLLETTIDDPKVSAEEKSRVYADLLTKYTELNRVEVEGRGEFAKKFFVAKGNPLEVIRSFREKVFKNANYLTQAQTDNFIDATQANLREGMKPKISALDFIKDYASFQGSPQSAIFKFAELGTRFMALAFDTDVSAAEAGRIAVDLVKEDAKFDNPSLVGLEDVPHEKFGPNGKTSRVFQGDTLLKADASVKADEDSVIIEKEGNRFRIPKRNLEKALSKGYRVVNA